MKIKRIFIGVVSVALSMLIFSSSTVIAAEMPNILVMGEDADQDTVPRNSRVFKRVLNALSNELHDEGFKVYDETAVTLDDFSQGRVRRTDAEIIDIARSVQQPPIDVVTIFAIYASADKKSYTTKIRTRIEGRLLNVKTGQRLGSFEVELPRADNAPADCNRECILETVGKNAKILAQDLGAVLTIKLANLVDGNGGGTAAAANKDSQLPSAYTLIFDGFTPDDMNTIEEYMVAFQGYEHHRPIKSGMRHAEYWYETQSNSARLNRNLRKMLDYIGFQGRVVFADNLFTVQKIVERKDR